MHGIMSSIAEFYSRNLANEVIKGSVQKAKAGGTPGKAPTGYLNVRKIGRGQEVRTVEIDPERGPLMALGVRGLRDRRLDDPQPARRADRSWPDFGRPGQKCRPSPSASHLHRLLQHPYYKGVVRYRGVLYEGSTRPLVSSGDLEQGPRAARSPTTWPGEKQREHPHYLKGSVFCGDCGSRLRGHIAKGRGGTLPIFHLRQGASRSAPPATQQAIRIESDRRPPSAVPTTGRSSLTGRGSRDAVTHPRRS